MAHFITSLPTIAPALHDAIVQTCRDGLINIAIREPSLVKAEPEKRFYALTGTGPGCWESVDEHHETLFERSFLSFRNLARFASLRTPEKEVPFPEDPIWIQNEGPDFPILESVWVYLKGCVAEASQALSGREYALAKARWSNPDDRKAQEDYWDFLVENWPEDFERTGPSLPGEDSSGWELELWPESDAIIESWSGPLIQEATCTTDLGYHRVMWSREARFVRTLVFSDLYASFIRDAFYGVTHLFGGDYEGHEDARLIANATSFVNLQQIDLTESGVDEESALALANSPNLPRLSKLYLAGNPIGPQVQQQIRMAPPMRDVEILF